MEASLTRLMFARAAWLLTAIATASLLTGCGTSRNVVTVQEASLITKGQELLDLQRARNEAAIDDQEYERLRKVLMARPH